MPHTEPSILSSSTCPSPIERTAKNLRPEIGSGTQFKLRFTAALVGLSCAAILVAAWHLQPQNLPFGPESQLSLPKCNLRETTGYPCPTCGMTTAWAQVVRGNLLQAFHANIAVPLLALASALAALAGIATALAGRKFYDRIVRPPLTLLRPKQWLYAGLALIALAWCLNAILAFVQDR